MQQNGSSAVTAIYKKHTDNALRRADIVVGGTTTYTLLAILVFLTIIL
jgi:hypothetical protein